MNIIGRLTRDAQVRTVLQDKQVVNFSVAINENCKNKQGERVKQTTYFDCAYWITPNVAKILTKGTIVELSGRVYARAWQGGDGQAHAGLNFHTFQIKLHGGGNGSGKKTEKPENSQASEYTATLQDSEFNNLGADHDLPF